MIKLYKNNAYHWFEKNNVYTIGYAFYHDRLYKEAELTELIFSLKEDIINKMKEITGYFAIVINYNEKITLISDIIRSFPLFYNKNGDIVDDIELLKGTLNELSLKELLQCRWISGDDTIYENVKQIENAQIVIIEKNKIKKQKYFEYSYCCDKEYSFEELDKIFANITKRMVTYLNNKTAVVPLSGGQDSRLLLYYLKKANYTNIITYTYGNKNSKEMEVSKKVAEFLEVPWHFIEYKKRSCYKKYNNKKIFSEIAEYFGRGYSIPHLQEWEAIDELLKRNIISKDSSVILPGFTLDFITGSHLCSEFMENKKLPKNIINKKIYLNNYNLTKKDNHIFDSKLENNFDICFSNDLLSIKKIANIYEKYDFEERQVKFITNAIRTYDYYGLQWYLPFWDKELIKFWNKVSLENRYQRKFFIDFVEYKYKSLMEYAPVYKKKELERRKNIFQKILALFTIYFQNPLNYYYYFKFTKYLKHAILEKNFSYDYYVANDYVRYLRRNQKNEI